MENYIITIVFIIIILIIEGFLCFCKYKKWSNKKNKCQKKLQVYVAEVYEKKTKRGGIVYKPIFKGYENNQEYTIDSAYYSNLVIFDVGQSVVLLVNPDNYKEFLYEDNTFNKGIIADVVCCLCPLIFIIAIVLVVLK